MTRTGDSVESAVVLKFHGLNVLPMRRGKCYNLPGF